LEQAINFYDQIVGMWGLFGIFALAILLGTLGTLAGLITRNLISLLALVLMAAAAIFFHHHLPLPTEVHIQLEEVKQRFR